MPLVFLLGSLHRGIPFNERGLPAFPESNGPVPSDLLPRAHLPLALLQQALSQLLVFKEWSL